MAKVQNPKSPKSEPKPRDRGKFGLSIPQAGAMVGLGKNASYDAARAGQIPVMEFGKQKIVPRLPWLKKIGATDVA
jgi:hypothetical protein